MHLLNKILVYRFAMWVAIVAAILFALLVAVGSLTVLEAERTSNHTNQVLSHLAETQAAINTAEQTGRSAILNESVRPGVPEVRSRALGMVEGLRTLTSDNPQQQQHIDALHNALVTRYAIQDEQVRRVERIGNTAKFPAELMLSAMDSAKNLELSIARVRETEIGLLLSRDEVRASEQFRLTYGVIFVFVLSVVAVIVMVRSMLTELGKQKEIAERLEAKVHKTEEGAHPALNEREIGELLAIIDARPQPIHALFL